MLRHLTRAAPLLTFISAALLFILVAMLIKIVVQSRSWQARMGAFLKRRKRFQNVSVGLASVFFLGAVILAPVGYYVPSVPVWVFYVGYVCIWLFVISLGGVLGSVLGFKIWVVCVLGGTFIFALATNVLPVPMLERGDVERAPTYTEADDRLEDKNPPYVKALTELRRDPHHELWYFNRSAAVIGLEVADATAAEKEVADRAFPTFRAAMGAASGLEGKLLPSVDLVDGFTKYFDDRLMAAVEKHVHDGSKIFPGGKQGLLAALLEEVLKQPEQPGRNEAAAYLAAAIELGGGQPEVPTTIADQVQTHLEVFMSDPFYCKPVGFYTESETLRQIFRRDRFLQKPFGTQFWAEPDLDGGFYLKEGLFPVVRMAEALLARPDLLQAYSTFRELAERLCNPEANLNLEDLLPCQQSFGDEKQLGRALVKSDAWARAQFRGNVIPGTLGVAFWPFATSKENRLFARLYGYTTELPETDAMDDLISAIKAGVLNLEPEPDSGWYDYQMFALETLLLPARAHEADKLLLHARYKKRLRKAFEAMLTKRRETQVKYAHILPTSGMAVLPLSWAPELSVEPTGTHYLRTARAYRFLATRLRDLLGDSELSGVPVGGSDRGALAELDDAVLLFYGLYLVVCNDLGMVPRLEPGEVAALPGLGSEAVDEEEIAPGCVVVRVEGLTEGERRARAHAWQRATDWLEKLETHQFLDQDVRVIVPVLSNYWGTEVRYWAVLGTQLLKVEAYYARAPRLVQSLGSLKGEELTSEDPEALLAEYGDRTGRDWESKEYVIPVQTFAEVTMGPTPLTREEFRSLCDQWGTKDEIIRALEGRSPHRNVTILLVALAALALVATALLVRVLHARRRLGT